MGLIIDWLFPRNYLAPNTILPTKSVIPVPEFEGILSLFSYTSPVRDLIHDLKFNFVSDTVPTIVDLITTELKSNYPHILEYWQENNFVLIPVPIHKYRQNYRGFNQSELITSALSSNLQLKADNSLVIRSHFSSPQSSKSRITRQNIKNSFSLVKTPPPNIILFDDVYTTGATLKSLRSVFPPNSLVWGLTLAG